jgi:hypothetical protein
MLKHGLGCHVWAGNKNHWIPDTPLSGMVLFPDGAALNVQEKLDYFMLRDFVPGHWLYRHIQNEKAAIQLGWNPPAAWHALVQSSKSNYRGAGGDRFTTEMAQREYRRGDIGTTFARQSGVWLNHLFVKEIETGKVSQYTVAEGISVPRGTSPSPGRFKDCLFRKRNRFDKWPLTLLPFALSGDGTIHSVRGLGARTKDFFELCNRVDNAMADQILLGATMTFKQTGDIDPDKLRLWRLGMMSIIPKNLDPVEGLQMPPLAQGPIAFRNLLKQGIFENNETYMQGTPEPKDRETAESFTMRTQNQGQVAKGVHSQYESNYGQFLEYMLRIAITPQAAQGNSYSAELARAFQQKCFKAGVPPEAFQHVEEVDPVFSTGAGSAAARLNALLLLWKYVYPTTTEARKINLERDLTGVATSGRKIDRYARSHDDNQMKDEDASFATLENNGLMQLGDAVVSDQQDHVEHLQIHLKKAEEVAQMVMQGQFDPEQGLAIIRKFGEHCAEHLKLLQTNPMRATEFKSLHKEWLALSIIADKLEQQVTQMKAAQARTQPPQQKISDNLQIGMAKVAANERLGQQKLASKGRLDVAKLAMEGRLERMRLSMNGAKEAA